MMTSALQRCVGDPHAFADGVWGRRPALRRASDPEAFSDLLTLDDVDQLISSAALRLPTFRLIQDGAPLPETAYTKSGRAGSRPLTGLADPARIFGLFDEGATIVLQGLHRFWLPLTRFCRDLEVELGHPTQVNAYITPPGSRGLAVHEDPHDVFVLQAFGIKQWDVWATRTSREGDAKTAAEGASPDISEDLRPGDALYMPRRTPHAAKTQETLSGHLTIGIPATTWRQVLRDVAETAWDAEAFDEPLPVGYHRDRPAFARHLEERMGEAVRVLEKGDPEEAADASIDRFLSTRPSILRGGLVARQTLDGIGDHSVVVRREGSICEPRVIPGGDRMTLLLGDRLLTLPARCEPAVRLIAERDRLLVQSLEPYLDEASRLVLVRRLIREGLLEVVGAG